MHSHETHPWLQLYSRKLGHRFQPRRGEIQKNKIFRFQLKPLGGARQEYSDSNQEPKG